MKLSRSGASLGAIMSETCVAQSKKEYIAKLNISLKGIRDSATHINLITIGVI